MSRHGLSGDPLYQTWREMKKRCRPDSRARKYYYDRGIRVHKKWSEDFGAFYEYVMKYLGPRPEGYSLDRIDNDLGYEPGNIRWASASEQNNNKRQRRPDTEPPADRKRHRVPPHLAKKGWIAA